MGELLFARRGVGSPTRKEPITWSTTTADVRHAEAAAQADPIWENRH